MQYESYIILAIYIYQEKDERWTAECPDLGTATFGDTIEEVDEEIEEMIKLHIQTLADVGELEKYLSEKNIKIYKKRLPQKIPLPFSAFRDRLTKLREYQLPDPVH